MEKISLIIPCYNEEESLPYLYAELKRVTAEMTEYDFEMLFVDDGSKDKTLQLLRDMSKEDARVKYISFSRNFGKESAMYAGFCNVTGDYAAVMDADMQDPPALLPKMMEIIKTGEYDSVATRRETRKGEPKLRSFFARRFYRMINKVSEANIVDGARDFRLMKRSMVDSIVSMCERDRFSKGIFGWIGFRTYWLSFENVERVAGKTKWSFKKLFKYSIDGIVDFSNAPLKFSLWFGILAMLGFMGMLAFALVRTIGYNHPIMDWPLLVSIICLSVSMVLFSLYIMGIYVAKIFRETQHRPSYIIGETNKDDAVSK
ncbi:MAG: glycosyltransferase family 2 protein [Clostridiales bacterium]|nr:glycosyltransferase family 2 protein [Clostridiales bacterium]